MLRPRRVAVIGASRRPDHIGHQILGNVVRHGFTGTVHPVHPTAHAVHSIRAYPRVADVPEPIDLAVIAVPAPAVVDVTRECAAAGVSGLVVISAGFREVGRRGSEREAALVEVVRGSGMRMIGPNCLGIINTDADYALNATFAPVMPASGRVAFLSQSGALGLSVLARRTSSGRTHRPASADMRTSGAERAPLQPPRYSRNGTAASSRSRNRPPN